MTPHGLCVLGVPPAAIVAASLPLPDVVSESEYIGSTTGTALGLVKCEAKDMCVPANTTIVLEDTLSVTETAPEGPVGEMHGYVFLHDTHPWRKYTVNAIIHCDDCRQMDKGLLHVNQWTC